jgi:hypothetical protein
MTALKQELIECISEMPDSKLIAIKPLLFLLSNTPLEAISLDDLSADEKDAVLKGREEYKRGECIDFEDYMKERGIA